MSHPQFQWTSRTHLHRLQRGTSRPQQLPPTSAGATATAAAAAAAAAATEQASSAPVAPEAFEALRGLASQALVDRVIAVIRRSFGTAAPATHRSDVSRLLACWLQLLFTVTLVRSKLLSESARQASRSAVTLSTLSVRHLCELCAAGLGDAGDAIRLASLKLVGVVLSLPEEVPLPDGALAQLVAKLGGVVNMDGSAEARQLATHLLRTLRQAP